MNLNNKNVVITGGAQGIGAAVARRFAVEGANIVVADVNQSACDDVARNCGGIGIICDVTQEAQVRSLVTMAENHFGTIDLFFSNAGICPNEPSHAASANNDIWTQCWDVHVMSHVYAARAVLPSMLERRDGYLLQMSSAAGLLSQIGNAAYSTTKHAAIGFAESMAITHGNDGIKVSVVCPQYVATPMLGYNDTGTVENVPGVITADALAETVVKGVSEEAFLILPHPDVANYIQFKAKDYEKWLGAMRSLRGTIIDEIGNTELNAMHKLVR